MDDVLINDIQFKSVEFFIVNVQGGRYTVSIRDSDNKGKHRTSTVKNLTTKNCETKIYKFTSNSVLPSTINKISLTPVIWMRERRWLRKNQQRFFELSTLTRIGQIEFGDGLYCTVLFMFYGYDILTHWSGVVIDDKLNEIQTPIHEAQTLGLSWNDLSQPLIIANKSYIGEFIVFGVCDHKNNCLWSPKYNTITKDGDSWPKSIFTAISYDVRMVA